ncbi:hypothetical protein [Devosia sp. CN2-171]|uniref:hypothetical protein n=1 Tax=Devosia sp. CN2-171 TaxID=3400909 RepID=UPI003BF7E4EC
MADTPDKQATTAIFLDLLKQAAAAHGVYEKNELGGKYDNDWPQWYAAHMTDALATLGYDLVARPAHQRR